MSSASRLRFVLAASALAALGGCRSWQASPVPPGPPTHRSEVRLTLADGSSTVLTDVLFTADSIRGFRDGAEVGLGRGDVVGVERKRFDRGRTVRRVLIVAPFLAFFLAFGG